MGKKIEFKDQYKHPKWQKKRLEVLEREDYTCQDCGNTESTLHIHHGYYERDKMLWEYPSKTLWCLCEGCHSVWEDVKRDFHYEIGQLNLADCMGESKHLIHEIHRCVLMQQEQRENDIKYG